GSLKLFEELSGPAADLQCLAGAMQRPVGAADIGCHVQPSLLKLRSRDGNLSPGDVAAHRSFAGEGNRLMNADHDLIDVAMPRAAHGGNLKHWVIEAGREGDLLGLSLEFEPCGG